MTKYQVVEINSERNKQLEELAHRIVEMMVAEATPTEAYYVLDILIQSLKEAQHFTSVEVVKGPFQ